MWGEKQRILDTLSGILQAKKVNQSISNIRHRAYKRKNVFKSDTKCGTQNTCSTVLAHMRG